ncbi:MAG: efflux transporter outer membrane subunit [Gammaproteobacteria bacterium]|nr:efflux transporter outer membrane subunit [Gammaproteobacteria bacterium]
MRKALALLPVVALITACTVGPHYHRPETPLPAKFDQATAEAALQPAGSKLWAAFGSPELDTLVARALVANTTIAQAAARFAETRALSGLSFYSWIPTSTAEGSQEKSQFSSQDPFSQPGAGRFETWRAGFDATWEIDLFGSLRNQNKAIKRRVEADAASLADARLSIVAETAQAWFSLISARERLSLLRRQLSNLEENVSILRARVDAGNSTALDLARSQAQARSLAAAVPQAEADVVRQEQRLAVLTAWPVETLRSNLAPQATIPELPELVATGTPEQWLKRRPDIRSAERELAAATADVGVEIAEFFPKLELLGSFGWTGQSREEIGQRAAERWSYGPSLTWSFLNIGRVRQKVKASEARADGAIARYQETVLRALEETENALAGFRAANQAEDELRAAAEAAGEAARLSKMRYDAGASEYLTLLDAERTLLDLENQHVQAESRRATALAALYKALAGDL